jgi:hypothetical protein
MNQSVKKSCCNVDDSCLAAYPLHKSIKTSTVPPQTVLHNAVEPSGNVDEKKILFISLPECRHHWKRNNSKVAKNTNAPILFTRQFYHARRDLVSGTDWKTATALPGIFSWFICRVRESLFSPLREDEQLFWKMLVSPMYYKCI